MALQIAADAARNCKGQRTQMLRDLVDGIEPKQTAAKSEVRFPSLVRLARWQPCCPPVFCKLGFPELFSATVPRRPRSELCGKTAVRLGQESTGTRWAKSDLSVTSSKSWFFRFDAPACQTGAE